VGAAEQTGWFVDREAPLHKKNDSLASATPWEAERELPPWLRSCPRAPGAPFAAVCGKRASPRSAPAQTPLAMAGAKNQNLLCWSFLSSHCYFPGRIKEGRTQINFLNRPLLRFESELYGSWGCRFTPAGW